MSSNTREVREPRGNNMVRRMVSLPWNLLSGFSRALGRRNSPSNPRQPFNFTEPSFQHQNNPLNVAEESTFLLLFEEKYGKIHPFFYACKLKEALKMAEEEKKLVFVYLHDASHPFTSSFCRETLCSDVVIQFLDVNFVSWGAVADRGEGVQFVATLKPGCFPCCAVVAPTGSGDHFVVLQQMEGPISPDQLVEILQRTMEEQGLAFQVRKLNEQQKIKIKEDRRLREEQDAAYKAAQRIDMEKERIRNSSREKGEKQSGASKTGNIYEKQRPKQSARAKEPCGTREANTQILIRFPNGERSEKSFSCSDNIGSIHRFIDSLGIKGMGNYRLVSGFPRRIYGESEMGMTLREAGLYPRASIFLELIP